MGEGGVVIDLTTLTPADTGRAVVYRDGFGYEQRGVLTGWNERVAFVRYYTMGVLGWCAQATNPEDLEWGE
jgi:hypothetical protein